MHPRRLPRKRALLEELEPRHLLSGLTVIAHGAEFFSTSRPSWIDHMATAIRTRVAVSTAIYAIRVEPNGLGGVKIAGMSRLAGPAPTSASSTNDETVLLLDWAAASTVSLGSLSADISVSVVASAVIPYLITAMPSIGLTAPLAEGSIQLIGHSRGAPLISEIAKDLGQHGIWVDQVTTLDPVPVPPDPGVSLKSNVIFADNYYQNSGDGILTPNGSKVTGAFNVGPLSLGGAYGTFDGSTHHDVTLFYHGTIDLAANASDGAHTVKDSWYPNNNVTRSLTGFYYSRLIGGTRPAAGIGTNFGGAGSRGTLSRSGAQWANIAFVTPSSAILAPGQSFTGSFRYNSFNSTATLQWFLDPDTNPYNGNSIALGAGISLGANGEAASQGASALVANASLGTYFLEARISNAAGTRYGYSAALSVMNPAPIGTIDGPGPATLFGWIVDQSTPATSVAIQVNVDGALFASGSADKSRPDLVKYFGSANHGYSYDLTGLSTGIHRIDVFAFDTTTGQPTLIGTRTITTNRPPTGWIDSLTATTLSGWAFDPEAGANSIQIRYAIDGNAPTLATASNARQDLAANASIGSPNHGFSIPLPQLTAGAHTVTVYAVDSTSKALISLGARNLTIPNPAASGGNALPFGTLDTASATKVTGWVQDPGIPTTSINVRIDVDGVPGTPFLANKNRADLTPVLGSSNHAYSEVLTLSPGEHRIDVYAINDDAGSTPVLIASRIVLPAPIAGVPSPNGWIDAVSSTHISGWAASTAVAGSGIALIRINIDGILGAAFNTSVARPDLPAAYITGGNTLGFSAAMPTLATGTHSVSLIYIDPLTLTATPLMSRSLVTA